MVWRTIRNHEGKSLYNIQGETWALLELKDVEVLIKDSPGDYLVLKRYIKQ